MASTMPISRLSLVPVLATPLGAGTDGGTGGEGDAGEGGSGDGEGGGGEGKGGGGLGEGDGGLGGGEGGGGLGDGDGGLGDGDGGSGGGDGGGGEAGGGIPQQASLQIAESEIFFFLWHSFVHFFGFCFSPLHAFSTFFRSFFLHVFLSLSAVQSFGDGVGAVPLLLPISGADSIFRMSTTGVVDGATAPTYSSMQKATSHLSRRGRTTCAA